MTIQPIVLFDDVEMWLTARIRTLLDDRTEPYAQNVFVGRKTPNPRRPRMVTVRRDGGGRTQQVFDLPRIGVNVWAETEKDATDLASLVCSLVHASADGNPVTNVRVTGGPYSIEDESKVERRYFTAELTARGKGDS